MVPSLLIVIKLHQRLGLITGKGTLRQVGRTHDHTIVAIGVG